MDLADVMEQVGDALDTIDGLRVARWGARQAQPGTVGMAIVTLPDRIDFDGTGRRGFDRIPDLTALVLIGAPTEDRAVRAIAAYAAGSGARSVKTAIDGHTYTACDTVRVTHVEFDTVKYAGTDYLAALFHIDITGPGGTA